MLLSLQWLREFVPFDGTEVDLGHRLTMAGLELDGITYPFKALAPLVVGFVAECQRHPEAEKLSVCRVDVGDEVLDIVCGAPNVAAGQKVAVVHVGQTLPNGLTIKPAKLRGASSNGMICSEAELGLSTEHDGILVLDPLARVGDSLMEALNLNDAILNISVTPNRGDCLSVYGLAREVSALYGLPLTLPAIHLVESGPDIHDELTLEVADGNLCPLYMGRLLENAIPAQSPGWMRYRLQSIGIRAISNLVDVTNYVLMELGHPLHAFDRDAVRGRSIIVRGADPGESMQTLDGHTRALLPSDITIRDTERTIALGGVMGGLNSEITADSHRVFLECAIFNPSSIRRTSRRLGLHSDAAYRFERGVDQTRARYALDRASALMAQVSGATVRTGVVTQEKRPYTAPTVSLRKEKIDALLGVSPDTDFCRQTLVALGLDVHVRPEGNFEVTIPGHRQDITREVDLIEEIARMYGVDRVEPVVPAIGKSLSRSGLPESSFAFKSRIKRWGMGLGLNEVINYSFTSHKELDTFAPEAPGASLRISILNPLSDEQNVLRSVLTPGLMHTLRNNLAQGAAGLRIFEVAAAFTADTTSETTAHEEQRLAILLYGSRFDASWPQVQADLDYADLVGILEHLFRSLTLPRPILTQHENRDRLWLAPDVTISINGETVGFAGQVTPVVAAPYHAKKPVWLAELNVDRLHSLFLAQTLRFTPLPVYPPIRRDITFSAPPNVTNKSIMTAISALKVPLLADVRLIDSFEPKDGSGRNLTYRLTFRHPERTLKDVEADKGRELIATSLPGLLGVTV